MGWHLALLAVGLALANCSPGERGMLEPVIAPGITLISTHGVPNDTARLATGGVTADVMGAWSNTGPFVEVVYRSVAAASLPIASRATWNGQRVAASHAWDRTVPQPGNAIGRPLLDGHAATGSAGPAGGSDRV